MKPPRNPPWPEMPEGVNVFRWIVGQAPAIRKARREAAEQYRAQNHEQTDWRPVKQEASKTFG